MGLGCSPFYSRVGAIFAFSTRKSLLTHTVPWCKGCIKRERKKRIVLEGRCNTIVDNHSCVLSRALYWLSIHLISSFHVSYKRDSLQYTSDDNISALR